MTTCFCTLALALGLLHVASAAMKPEHQAVFDKLTASDEVITLTSGVQYKVLVHGVGQHNPLRDSEVEVRYTASVLNGQEFETTNKSGKPAAKKMAIGKPMPEGLQEALVLMVEGDEWEVHVPSDLGYGDEGLAPRVYPGDGLVYDVTLKRIVGEKVMDFRHRGCTAMAKQNKSVLSEIGCSEEDKRYLQQLHADFKDDPVEMRKTLNKMRNEEVKTLSDEKKLMYERRLDIMEHLSFHLEHEKLRKMTKRSDSIRAQRTKNRRRARGEL